MDPLAAQYYPLLGLPPESSDEHVRQVTGTVESWRSFPAPPFFRLRLRTSAGELLAIEGAPEEVILPEPPAPAALHRRRMPERTPSPARVSPIVVGTPPRVGASVTAVVVVGDEAMTAERLDVRERRTTCTWYHRGLLAAGELQPQSVAIFQGRQVWVRTTLAEAPGLVLADLSPVLEGHPDQPAWVVGTLAPTGVVEEPRLYIEVDGAYLCLYGAEVAAAPAGAAQAQQPEEGLWGALARLMRRVRP